MKRPNRLSRVRPATRGQNGALGPPAEQELLVGAIGARGDAVAEGPAGPSEPAGPSGATP